MKMEIASARMSDAAEAEAPRTPGDDAKQAEHKVRFAAAMGRARGESMAKAEPVAEEAEAPAESSAEEPTGKARKKRSSAIPNAVLAFDVTLRPETKLALLPDGAAVAARGPAAPSPAQVSLATTGAALAEGPVQALPAVAEPAPVPTVDGKQAGRRELRQVDAELPDDATGAAQPEATKPEPTDARTAPRAEPPAATKPVLPPEPTDGARPKAERRDAEAIAEKPRAVRAETTAAKPLVVAPDFVPLREPVAVAMKPEVAPAVPRELVEATPMLTSANLAQAVVTLPDLGRIEIRSRMQDGALEVELRADRAEGRAALENAREAMTAQVAAIAPVAQIVVGPTQVNAADGARPGHEGVLSDSSQQPRDSGSRDSSGGSRDRGGHREETRPVAQMPRGRVRIVL